MSLIHILSRTKIIFILKKPRRLRSITSGTCIKRCWMQHRTHWMPWSIRYVERGLGQGKQQKRPTLSLKLMFTSTNEKSVWGQILTRSRRLSTKQQQLFLNALWTSTIGTRRRRKTRKRKLSTTWSPKIVRSLKLSCCWLDQSKVPKTLSTRSYKASISSVGCGLKTSDKS